MSYIILLIFNILFLIYYKLFAKLSFYNDNKDIYMLKYRFSDKKNKQTEYIVTVICFYAVTFILMCKSLYDINLYLLMTYISVELIYIIIGKYFANKDRKKYLHLSLALQKKKNIKCYIIHLVYLDMLQLYYSMDIWVLFIKKKEVF